MQALEQTRQFAQHPRRAAALVVVLLALLLTTGLLLAFFSRASWNRLTSANSSATVRGDFLFDFAIRSILEDFTGEMIAGSEPPSQSQEMLSVYVPVTVDVAVPNDGVHPVSPSMVPQQHFGGRLRNVVKASNYSVPFFEVGPGHPASGPPANGAPDRASRVATDSPASRRPIPLEYWLKPGLISDAEQEFFTPPDWVYVDRMADNPFAGAIHDEPAETIQGFTSPVIGRYAYVAYDIGCLLDVNRLGGSSAASGASRKSPGEVPLSDGSSDEPNPVPWSSLAPLAAWRSPVPSKQESTGIAEAGQGILGRVDLMRAAQHPALGLPIPMLYFLTHQTRFVDAPVYSPNPHARQFQAGLFADHANHEFKPYPPLGTPPGNIHPLSSPDPAELNPSLLAAKFQRPTVLERPDGALLVPAGTPALFRRFPLSKLSIFEEPTPSPEELLYYFGLQRAGHRYRYVQGIEDPPGSGRFRIARLQEAADANREPNFFEILQAVVLTGSLGKSLGPRTTSWENNLDNSVITSHLVDSLRNRQILQIGANIIDQWDADDVPTTIEFPSGIAGRDIEIFGVENLPYINQTAYYAYRPEYDPDRFQLWMLFNVWNPHRNARTPAGINRFRVVPTAGSGSGLLALSFAHPNSNYMPIWDATSYAKRVPAGMTGSGTFWPVRSVHGNRELAFPAAAYSEPTTVGDGLPADASATPGILLLDWNLSEAAVGVGARPNPAIPAKHERPEAIQRVLNELYDMLDDPSTPNVNEAGFPYRALSATSQVVRNGPQLFLPGEEGLNSQGDRVYPPGTSFEIPASHRPFWVFDPPLTFGSASDPSPLRSDPVESTTRVYAEMGVKAHNQFRYFPNSGDPLRFELQAMVADSEQAAGGWRTIQIIEGWHAWMHPILRGGESLRLSSDPLRPLRPTHHSVLDPQERAAFYLWNRSETNMKVDPRTNRFAFTGDLEMQLGTRLRRNRESWNGAYNLAAITSGNWYIQGAGMRFLGHNFIPPPTMPPFSPGFEFRYRMGANAAFPTPYGLLSNHPFRLDAEHPMRYADLDGVVRPADGFWGAIPTASPDSAGFNPRDRPEILNRPFRSVGELGMVFRDVPWKSLDFATERSGDLGLLEVFSLEEAADPLPLVAGLVNLNTPHPEILRLLLNGSINHPNDPESGGISMEQAGQIAEAIVEESGARPFAGADQAVARVLGNLGPNTLTSGTQKPQREAAIRPLASLTATSTWNLLLAVVAQSGRLSATAAGAEDFMVESEVRGWVSVAIDRRTGKVVAATWERLEGN